MRKTKNTKEIILLILAFLIFSPIIGTSINNQNDWQLYKELNGVLIYYKSLECHLPSDGLHQEFVLLKFVNTTDTKLKIEFDFELWYDNKCTTCDKNTFDENHREFELDEGANVEGTCTFRVGELTIFKKFLNYKDLPELTKFELKNLNVTPV